MFGGYLKQVREEIGLTQKELATKLNLASAEFASIGPVTISRWERGTTAPTVIKAIKILRVLTTNLMPFLRQLPTKVDKNLLAEIAEYRFKSPWATLMASSYDVPTPAGEVLECPLLESDQDVYLANLKHFFSNIDLDNKALFDVDLYQYQLDKKLFARKFIDKNTKEILGHRIAFLLDANELRQYFSSPYFPLPVQQSRSYSSNRVMAMCTVSRYSSNEAVFWENNASGARFVATHANIHDIYFYAIDQWSVNYMESLNAEKVAFDTPDEDGIVKIGNQSFKRCLYRVDSANWLSRPEVISLLQNA
ncbi:helix-turn-helix domain-containing protein [Vibrio sp. Sgm 5]|uniref:helix-turn-helix domain-containing protein n=1 Tax=Vibrio sp. Sgm 5 TaxID=2994387 RepID=UPI002249855D|nr:helix-turn-helix transcriptional regulator [Vibrio sp. Sgm 5]MCX2789866.1 helix-turn-helix transcriptional regulator [Vibrio sp. Sgm 5]